MAMESQCDVVMFWDWDASSVWESSLWFKRSRQGAAGAQGHGSTAFIGSDYREISQKSGYVQDCLAG